MASAKTILNGSYRQVRRVAIATIGFTVLAFGIVLLVTPGPAFVVIPIGLGILAIEFAWARRWLQKIKDKAQQGSDYLRGRSGKPCAEAASSCNASGNEGSNAYAPPPAISAPVPSSAPNEPVSTALDK